MTIRVLSREQVVVVVVFLNQSMLSVQQVWTEQVQASPPQQKMPLSSFLVMHLSIRSGDISKARIL